MCFSVPMMYGLIAFDCSQMVFLAEAICWPENLSTWKIMSCVTANIFFKDGLMEN